MRGRRATCRASSTTECKLAFVVVVMVIMQMRSLADLGIVALDSYVDVPSKSSPYSDSRAVTLNLGVHRAH